MKAAELRQKDVDGLKAEIKELQGSLRSAHAKSHATTRQHWHAG